MKTFIFSLWIFGTSTVASGASGAGCWIVGQTTGGTTVKRLLMVRDTWSGRLSLPGGGIENGETPEIAAVRELKEETGISGRVLDFGNGDNLDDQQVIFKTNRFVLLRCASLQPILVRKDFSPELPEGGFAGWVRHDAIDEIRSLHWVEPTRVDLKQWRFPSQRGLILEAWQDIQKSQPSVELNILDLETKSFELEKIFTQTRVSYFLPWIWGEKTAIRWVQNLPFDIWIWKFFSFLGEGGFLFFAVIALGFWISRSQLRVLLLALVFSTWINGLLKHFFASPRPFELFPELQKFGAHGYGFPSGHAQTAFVFGATLAFWPYRAKSRDRKLWTLPFMLVGFATALARVAGGAHSFLDIAGGAFLGLGIAAVFQTRLIQKYIEQPLLTPSLWILMMMSLFRRAHPEAVSIAWFTLGIVIVWALHGIKGLSSPNAKISKIEIGGSLLLMFGLQVIFKWAKPIEGAFIPCFIHLSLQYLTLGLMYGFYFRVQRT